MTSTSSIEEITKQYNEIQNDPPQGCSVDIEDENDMYHWQGNIEGPEFTPYENGIFFLSIEFPSDYPSTSPNIRFITKIYHPNIDDKGFISLDILRDQWNPELTISNVLVSIRSLLMSPNLDDSLMPEIVDQFTTKREEFDQIAKEWTEMYAL